MEGGRDREGRWEDGDDDCGDFHEAALVVMVDIAFRMRVSLKLSDRIMAGINRIWCTSSKRQAELKSDLSPKDT